MKYIKGKPKEIKEGYYYYFYKDETYIESRECIWDDEHEKILHRDGDKPAVIFSNGEKEYYKYGKYHFDYNLSIVEYIF